MNGQRQVSRITDEKGETWSPFGMSKVRSRHESLLADLSMPALQPLLYTVIQQELSYHQQIARQLRT